MALSKVCVLSLLLLSLPSVAQDDDHATMQAKFPNQYQSWALRDPLINPPVHSHFLRAAQLEPPLQLRGVAS